MRLNELEEKIKIPDVIKKEIGKVKATNQKKSFGGMAIPGGPRIQDHMSGSYKSRARKSIVSKNYKQLKRTKNMKDLEQKVNEIFNKAVEGYKVLPNIDKERYTEIPGLEGPFQTMSGKPIYYDPKEGAYYDRDTDMYLTYDEFKALDEGYSPGDENEEGMVSNCCGAPIMDVYQGHGRCSDCKEMASAVSEAQLQDDVAVRRDGKTLSKGEKAKLQRQGVLMKEGGTKSVIDMIANADNPEEMVMDLVDRGDAIGKFLYSELEQLATEAGTTFNNAESMPEDFVDELLANMGIEGYTFEGAPKSSPRPKPRPKTIPRPKPRPTTRIGGMPGGSTRGIDPKDNYSPEDLKRLLMQSAMLEMEEAEEEGMIVYVGDQKFEYADYTIQDAMRIVDEYADEMEGEPYEVYNADGELVASGTMRSGAFHEPGIEEGHSPHKKGTKKYKAHMAAMHANSVDLNAMRDALKLDERTDANTVVAQYTRACLDHRHNTWGKVCEQIDHVRSFVKEDVDVNNVRLQIRKMHKQEGLDRKIQIKENVDKLRQIVKDKSAMSIKFSDGSMKVDMTTASIFLQIFDKVKEETQEKIVDKIQTKSGFLSMLEMMYKKIG